MIVRPNKFSDLYDEDFNANAPVTEEALMKLIYNMNLLRALMPIGMVKAYQVNIPTVPRPSEVLFQYCDGSEITEPTSPLNGVGTQNVPNLVGKYIRGDDGGAEVGGNATVDFTHTHTTGPNAFPPTNKLEAGDEKDASQNAHTHDVPNGLGEVTMDVAHMQICFYMKIGG